MPRLLRQFFLFSLLLSSLFRRTIFAFHLPSPCRLERTQLNSSISSHKNSRRRLLFQQISLLFTSTLLYPATALGMNPSETDDKLQKVVVIGANGQTGFRLVQLLHKSPKYQPIAMIREASQASRFQELDIPCFLGDLDSSISPTVQDLEGAHTVIFAAGAGRYVSRNFLVPRQ